MKSFRCNETCLVGRVLSLAEPQGQERKKKPNCGIALKVAEGVEDMERRRLHTRLTTTGDGSEIGHLWLSAEAPPWGAHLCLSRQQVVSPGPTGWCTESGPWTVDSELCHQVPLAPTGLCAPQGLNWMRQAALTFYRYFNRSMPKQISWRFGGFRVYGWIKKRKKWGIERNIREHIYLRKMQE